MIRLLVRGTKEALLILCAVLPLALIVNHVRTDGIPLWPQTERVRPLAETARVISTKEAAERFQEAGTLFVDARAREDYCAGHIAGAVNLPVRRFNEHFLSVVEKLEASQIIITYCDGIDCAQGTDLAAMLEEMGFAGICFFVDGWTEWISSGHPIEKGNETECAEGSP